MSHFIAARLAAGNVAPKNFRPGSGQRLGMDENSVIPVIRESGACMAADADGPTEFPRVVLA